MAEASEATAAIPEGFFDDNVEDARARHVEVKDEAAEEWERFEKVMEVEEQVSTEVTAADHEDAMQHRALSQVQEQQHLWSRVDILKAKFDSQTIAAAKTTSIKEEAGGGSADDSNGSSSDDGDDDDFGALGWRSKGI